MNKAIQKFFSQKPELVVEWQDDYTDAKGWLVINSLRNGAAGGGTRMRSDCALPEVVELAKTMEIKFVISGPDIGGAKSGIKYDFKNEKDKLDVLERWFKFNLKHYKTHYGTGGDQNLDFGRHVFPLLFKLGIKHPQEGIVRGLYKDLNIASQDKIIDNLVKGVSLPIKFDKFLESLNFKLADVATGYGVYESLNNFFKLTDQNLKGKRVILEGFGNVGMPSVYFLYKNGAKIVGIYDKDWSVINKNGIDVVDFIKNKNTLIKEKKEYKINYPEADIFIPAATSHTIDKIKLDKLKSAGVSVFSCGANNPFVNSEVGDLANNSLSVLPDFLANCGTARLFSYFMKPNISLSEVDFLKDLESCMYINLKEAISLENNILNLTDKMYQIVLEKIND